MHLKSTKKLIFKATKVGKSFISEKSTLVAHSVPKMKCAPFGIASFAMSKQKASLRLAYCAFILLSFIILRS